jgi:hypothetical protein
MVEICFFNGFQIYQFCLTDLAEEAGPVLRAFVGARPAEPYLCLLKGRKRQNQDTQKNG